MGIASIHCSNPATDEEALAVVARAAELSPSFAAGRTSDIYGPHTNEKLLCELFGYTSRIVYVFSATSPPLPPH